MKNFAIKIIITTQFSIHITKFLFNSMKIFNKQNYILFSDFLFTNTVSRSDHKASNGSASES
jgi:hypothetical protein